MCVIEANYTKVNDSGQKNATWCLKVLNFDVFSKKMHKMAVFHVAVNSVHRKHDDGANVLKLSRLKYYAPALSIKYIR